MQISSCFSVITDVGDLLCFGFSGIRVAVAVAAAAAVSSPPDSCVGMDFKKRGREMMG